jgi:hypothetical protein
MLRGRLAKCADTKARPACLFVLLCASPSDLVAKVGRGVYFLEFPEALYVCS